MCCKLVAFALFFLAGCSRQGGTAFQRIAILPLENLTGDPGLDWMGGALAEVVRYQITGAPLAHPRGVESLENAPSVRPTHALLGYFRLARGRLRAYAVLQDADRSRTTRTLSAEALAGDDVLALGDAIARQLEPRARPYGTRSATALKAYLEAVTADDPASAPRFFERAVAADPAFGSPYQAWAQWLIARGDSRGAQQVIAAALQKRAEIAGPERARLELMRATLESDRAARLRALATLARLTPADAEVFRAIANTHLAEHDYPAAVSAYRQALEREPDNPAFLNELGYAQAYAGNLEAAVESLRRYRELRPRDANPSDSLGDVHFHLGRFPEAEKHYLEAYAKSPGFLGGGDLYKAAQARLMTGDVAGADEHFRKFVEYRRSEGDAFIELRQAEWEYLSGRRKQALARLERFGASAGSVPGACSLAWSQLSIWRLESGQAAQARRDALRAVSTANTPPSRALARVCSLLTEPARSASEWAAGAERTFPDPSQSAARDEVLGYAFLFSRSFSEAARVFGNIYRRTPPASPEPVRVLLGWALLESGQDPGRLLSAFPIPDPRIEQPFACLSFPRLFYLRGKWLEKQGRRDEARANYELFFKLAGDLPRR